MIFARPYDAFGPPADKNERIFLALEKHPERFTLPMTRAEIRASAAWHLTDPDNLIWEVWRDSEFVGILLVSRIVPGLDALLHFVFFDGDLLGKRTFLKNFCAFLFEELHLERISLEVPEHVQTLVSFARRKLGFRYEGESRQMTTSEHKIIENEPAVWVARQGSRREHGCRTATGAADVICLRLLRSER